jgi:DMSO reductase iron-sulfur subunit
MGSSGQQNAIQQKFKSSAKKLLQSDAVEIWDRRDNEPDYAKLSGQQTDQQKGQQKGQQSDQQTQQQNKALNVYDQPIDLIELVQDSVPREQSLYINGNPAVGKNPNRNKQHGFYFNADNCIGCHACESACAEKNETPSHLAFRSVGYVEGGSYPDFQRLNISMACNHCDDPVCLKGCPTLAYTKHTEYGAVLQDPDTCFGCGYCTWVCPYNAPQLDPVKGQVSKCNMCVDRLEVGLKPSCVSACVGNALDFGVVEQIPENREQAKTHIPGFPTPEISRPNIRFEQKKGLPEEMTRTDSAPLKYHRDQASGEYKPVLDAKHGTQKQWSVKKLSSRENPLVLFTLSVQAGMGVFIIPFIASLFGVKPLQALLGSNAGIAISLVAFALAGIGMFLSASHLGKPQRFYRGFNNLRYSPLSREAFGVAVFMAFAGFNILAIAPANTLLTNLLVSITGYDFSAWAATTIQQSAALITGVLAVAGAAGALFYMHKCYRIPARPFWNHWQTATSFVGNTLSLGGLLVVLIAALGIAVLGDAAGYTLQAVCRVTGIIIGAGIALEALGVYFHAKFNHGASHEGAASHYVQTTQYGKTYLLRNALLAVGLLLLICLLLGNLPNAILVAGWLILGAIVLTTALIGRALFYVLVIPTTMPGAFFWRNKGFEQHATETGLIDVVDAGIVRAGH